MAISKIDISCLFKKSKDCEIGSTTYVVGTSGPKDVDLYPGLRPTRTKSAKYSNSLFLYKAWKENNLFVVTSADNNTIYAEYIDSYSSDAVIEKSFLANKDGFGNWDIKIGEYASPRTLASIISVISCVMEKCLTNPDSITPLCFCDTVYYGYIYNNKDAFSYESEPDRTIFAQAQRAYNSGLLTNVICGVNPFNPFEVESETTPVIETPSDFVSYQNGEGFIPYEWDDDSTEKIVPVSFLENFVPTKEFFTLARKLTYRISKVKERLNEGLINSEAIGRDFLNIRLVGNPGSGKTVLAQALSAALKLPLYTVPVQKYSEEDTFEGKNKMVEGKLSFVQTDFLKAYKNGGIVVLEEINLADPALVMGALGQAIEPPFILNENGFQNVTRHPLCVVIATQNVGTIGSKGVNQALVSRFNHTYVINDPTEEEFVNRLMTVSKSKATCSWLYKSYVKIKEHLCSSEVSAEDIALALTFRACLGVLEDIEEGASRKEALNNFYAIIYGESPEIAEKTLAIINSLPGT